MECAGNVSSRNEIGIWRRRLLYGKPTESVYGNLTISRPHPRLAVAAPFGARLIGILNVEELLQMVHQIKAILVLPCSRYLLVIPSRIW